MGWRPGHEEGDPKGAQVQYTEGSQAPTILLLVAIQRPTRRKPASESLFNNFKTAIKRADNMFTKTNEAIKASKSAQRQSGDGIRLQLFAWMKILFSVQQPAYHGGKLIGKDCMKMTANAYKMFTHFASRWL